MIPEENISNASVASTVLRTEAKAVSKLMEDLMATAPQAAIGAVTVVLSVWPTWLSISPDFSRRLPTSLRFIERRKLNTEKEKLDHKKTKLQSTLEAMEAFQRVPGFVLQKRRTT